MNHRPPTPAADADEQSSSAGSDKGNNTYSMSSDVDSGKIGSEEGSKRSSTPQPPATLWEIVKECFPVHVKNPSTLSSNEYGKNKNIFFKESIPSIGIQRSATSVPPTRTTHFSSITIK